MSASCAIPRCKLDQVAPRSIGGRCPTESIAALVELGVDVEALAAQAVELAEASQPATQRAVTSTAVAAPRGFLFTRRIRAGVQSTSVQAKHDWLTSALRRCGRHDDDCAPDRGCTCGLTLVLDSLDENPAAN